MLRYPFEWGLTLCTLACHGCMPVGVSDATSPGAPVADMSAASQVARVSAQARKNLGLTVAPVQLATYYRTVDLPAVVTDRPGVSDRGVVSPVTGVVTNVLAYPGDTVEPERPLFTIRLVSERLHASQLELFKATREIELAKQQRQRLTAISESGALAQSRIIEIDNRIALLDVNVQAYRQDLAARGLARERIDAAARGEFVTEVTVHAPIAQPMAGEAGTSATGFSFEVQSLRVSLGQQVEAGQVLCDLADHRALLIEGHGFKPDLPHLQSAARSGAPVTAEFEEVAGQAWPPLGPLHISHVANSVDPESRVINFFVPLANHWRTYKQEGRTRFLWRFLPGDRLRLRVPVEKIDNVFVLPREAVVRDGADAFVFRQNGDLFERRPVHVLDESRAQIAIANDGSIKPGAYLAQNGAASLNRVVKAQAASGMPANVHVHADGTVHAAH